MPKSALTAIPDNISDLNLSDIVRDAKDFALLSGLGFRPRDASIGNDSIEVAPLTLFPSPFPREAFNLAKKVQTSMNLLMNNVSHDMAFLTSSLGDTIKVDDFTRNLLNLYQESEKIGLSQQLSFGLFRTDYMLHQEENNDDIRILQVESNAIAAGFGNLGPKVKRMHEYILNKYAPDPSIIKDIIPANDSDTNFPYSFVLAFESYGNPSAIILFVVEDRTVNLCDQRGHDFAISKIRPDIKVIRRTWTELHSSASVDENRRLIIDGKFEVALVYYRVLYDPSQYPKGEESWKLRLKIETSKVISCHCLQGTYVSFLTLCFSQAIKCPSINYHLSGVKKLQQILVDRNTLEKFLPTKEAELLSTTFAGLWSFDSDQVIDMALKNPEKFVMKPQREGGGHNIYGDDIVKHLEPMRNSSERDAYILMQLMTPPVIDNILIGRDVEPIPGHVDQVTCELGIFGSILASKKSIVFNHEDGHVLRCKKIGVNEGGISAGFGAIDSPLLY